jgi:hypothetical protein
MLVASATTWAGFEEDFWRAECARKAAKKLVKNGRP